MDSDSKLKNYVQLLFFFFFFLVNLELRFNCAQGLNNTAVLIVVGIINIII